MRDERFSEDHLIIKAWVISVLDHVRSIDDLCVVLEKNEICYEDHTLANGRRVFVFTGSSAYEISGFAVGKKNNRFVIDDI